MVLLQNKIKNNGLSDLQEVSLANIRSNDYQLNQVQTFINEAISDLSLLLRQKSYNISVLNNKNTVNTAANNFLQLNNVYYDPYNINNNGGFLVPFSGVFFVFGGFYITNTTGSGVVDLSVWVNNVKKSVIVYENQLTFCQSFEVPLILNQGDLVRLYTGQNISLNYDGELSNQIGIFWA